MHMMLQPCTEPDTDRPVSEYLLVFYLQVPVRVPLRVADVHSEQSRLLSDGRGADSGGAAERTQQQKDQEEEKRYTLMHHPHLPWILCV